MNVASRTMGHPICYRVPKMFNEVKSKTKGKNGIDAIIFFFGKTQKIATYSQVSGFLLGVKVVCFFLARGSGLL